MLSKKDRKDAMEILSTMNGKLDKTLFMLDTVRDALLEGETASPEKLMEDGIARLMAYDGAPKAVK